MLMNQRRAVQTPGATNSTIEIRQDASQNHFTQNMKTWKLKDTWARHNCPKISTTTTQSRSQKTRINQCIIDMPAPVEYTDVERAGVVNWFSRKNQTSLRKRVTSYLPRK